MACNAACESHGILGEIRTCTAPEYGGEECTRSDQTTTNSGNRVEMRETACENASPCPGDNYSYLSFFFHENRLRKLYFFLILYEIVQNK